ncbi:ATP-binding cassette domain-containing protein [Escherichia coli]|nr:ATP-binding cassette domain-containing protein [Escherichia coli]
MNQPLLSVNNLTHLYAPGKGFSDVSFDLWPGEVLGIVGESGSGKTTLLKSISARLTPQQGEIHYENRSLYAMSEADRRRLLRTEWGVVHQHPLDGLRGLVVELNLAVVIVTHDLGVARLLADRLLVMKQGQVVESGLTDRVLDDPHHPYTQLLVSSVLQN